MRRVFGRHPAVPDFRIKPLGGDETDPRLERTEQWSELGRKGIVLRGRASGCQRDRVNPNRECRSRRRFLRTVTEVKWPRALGLLHRGHSGHCCGGHRCPPRADVHRSSGRPKTPLGDRYRCEERDAADITAKSRARWSSSGRGKSPCLLPAAGIERHDEDERAERLHGAGSRAIRSREGSVMYWSMEMLATRADTVRASVLAA
jgi:hypothetical protein